MEQKSGKAQHGLGKVSVPSSPPCLWDVFSSGPQHCNPRENKIIITLYNNNNTSSLCWGCYPRHGGFGAPLCPISAGTSDVRGPSARCDSDGRSVPQPLRGNGLNLLPSGIWGGLRLEKGQKRGGRILPTPREAASLLASILSAFVTAERQRQPARDG